MEEIIRIKDKRKGVFTVDNVVMNGYGKALGATGIAFYIVLCRYANRETQEAYPSLTLIQNETGMNRTTILAAAKRAEELKLIKRKTKKGSYTVYTLLEPKKPSSYEIGLARKKRVNQSDLVATSPIYTTPVRFMKRTNEDKRMKNNKDLKSLKEMWISFKGKHEIVG